MNKLARYSLAEDILIEILLRLPVKSLIRFKCVSKQWRSLICDSHFAKTHHKLASEQKTLTQSILVDSSKHKFQSLDDNLTVKDLTSPFKQKEKTYLLSSCNGLVLVGELSEINMNKRSMALSIWNPCTGFVRKLSNPKLETGWATAYPNYSLGYVSATDDYKIVFLCKCCHIVFGNYFYKAEIFSVRANSWKTIEVPPYFYRFRHSGVVLYEAVHWLTTNKDYDQPAITCFCLAKEEFRPIILPDFINKGFCPRLRDSGVGVFSGGSLCAWQSVRTGNIDFEFWVMREYNVHESWTCLYRFNGDELGRFYSGGLYDFVFVTECNTLVLSENKKLARIEFHKDEKPVCQIVGVKLMQGWRSICALQYIQTLISVDNV